MLKNNLVLLSYLAIPFITMNKLALTFLIIVGVFLSNNRALAQNYPKVSIPDPSKSFDALAHFKIKPYKKKTYFDGHFRYIKKYDNEGRVIMDEEYENDGNRTRTTRTYQGNLLVEEINEKLPEKNFKREVISYDDGIAIEHDFKKEKKIYKTVIDPKTHQIVSGTLNEVQKDSTLKPIATFLYDKQSRITKVITSKFNHTNYIYQSENLVREEHCTVINDKIFQIRGTEYQYDKNNNLTRIEKFTETAAKDKLVRGQNEQIDSLFYKNNKLTDRKNQMEHYHYDYDAEGHLIYYSFTRLNNKKESVLESSYTYTYQNNLLVKEVMRYISSKVTMNTEYEYNDQKQVIKTISYYDPATDYRTTFNYYNPYGHLIKSEFKQDYKNYTGTLSVGSIYSYTYF